MDRRSTGKIIRIAVAASVAVHAVFAAVVHSQPVTAAQEPKPTRILIVVELPKPTPTPPPERHQVQPRRPHQSSQSVQPHVHPIVLHNNNRTGPIAVVPTFSPGTPGPPPDGGAAQPGPAQTGVPATPSPTPKPACSAPDIAAKSVDAISPEAPADAQGAIGTAKIRVDLNANGDVVGASVFESSGSLPLDRTALQAARESRYAPEEKNCKNVPGSYLFTVDFEE